MHLSQLIEELKALRARGYGNLPVVKSQNTTGDVIAPIEFDPTLYKVKDVGKFRIEPDFTLNENGDVLPFEPNCILI